MRVLGLGSKSLKGGYVGDHIGATKGDTRSLDYSSCNDNS